MKLHHKKKAVIGLSVGLAAVASGLALLLAKVSPSPLPSLILIVIGIPFYIWGCLAFARAKGYTTAIVLTAVFGLLLPFVLLLALPDKHPLSRRNY